MIRIAVTDTNEERQSLLCKYIFGYDISHSSNSITAFPFSSGSSLINAIYEFGSFDLYFIEIDLEGEDGLKLGKRIREMDASARIVFVSESADYALESYSVRAYYYILRPYDYRKIWQVLDMVIPEIHRMRQKMILIRNTDRGEQLIPFHEILYAERSLRGMTVHLTNDRMVESVTLRSSFRNAVSELLKDDRFYLAGASILLNLDHVRGLKQECILLADETSLIVPKRYFSDLRMTWIRHWGAMDPLENKQD